MTGYTAPTWARTPQSGADDFDWTMWFAPPAGFRDTVWHVHAEGLDFTATPERVRTHG